MPSNGLVERSLKYHLIILKILGHYPYDSWPEIYLPYGLFLFVLFTLPPSILPLTHLIVTREKDMEIIAQNGFLMIELTILIVKLLPCQFNPGSTIRTVYTLNSKIFNSYSPEQNVIVADVAKICKYVLGASVAICFLAEIPWAGRPLLYEDRMLPLDLWLPFDPFRNTVVYLAMYLFIFIAVLSCSISSATLDTLIASLIYHAACQLKILKDTLMHLNQRTEDQISMECQLMSLEEKEKLKNGIIYQKICHCIDHYDAIFQFVSDLENTYSFIIFIQLLGSIIVICICCFQLSEVELISIPFVSMISFTSAFLMEILVFCYSGTLLYEESSTVNDAIYLSEWYTYDKKSKKALLILMERAKRPMKVTVGKLLDLSLETFTTIIRRSYSLLAVLKNY